MLTPEIEAMCSSYQANPTRILFSKIMSALLARYPNSANAIAYFFEVAVSTVKRWGDGTARLHPRISKQVVGYIMTVYWP
jgi:hypothetical protein